MIFRQKYNKLNIRARLAIKNLSKTWKQTNFLCYDEFFIMRLLGLIERLS
jgi:hypothetical protein